MTEQPAERPKKRRALRRLAIFVAVLLMIPVWYVGAWLLCALALARGYVGGYGKYAAPLFAPVTAYADSEMYGAEGLQWLYCRVMRKEVLRARRALPRDVTFDAFVIQLGPLSPRIKGRMFLDAYDAFGGDVDAAPYPADPWSRTPAPPSALTEASADTDSAKHAEKP